MLYNAGDQNSAIFNWITKIVMNNWEKWLEILLMLIKIHCKIAFWFWLA